MGSTTGRGDTRAMEARANHGSQPDRHSPNHCWHLDFVQRFIGRASTFTLILLDDYSRFVVGHGVDDAERAEFLADMGLEETGLDRLIKAGYQLLHLITYFTVGPKEARAWTVARGTRAPQAAGVIHGDFERGFIRAETIPYADFIACNGEQGAKEAGKMRSEGKTYRVADGDVLHILFNT